MAVDASHIYWTNAGDGTIWRANLDGTNAQSIVQGEGQNSLFAVAVDGNHLYWTNRSEGMVKQANLDGTNPQTLLLGQNQQQAVAVDANYVYWSNLGDETGAIRWANLVDGTNPQVFIPNTGGPQLMAVLSPAPPLLGFTPSPYDYGQVPTGQTAAQTFTLANSGGQATGPLTVTMAGSGAFTTTGDTCTGTSLAPDKSCTVSVRFAPTSVAAAATTLTATSKTPAATATDALTGTGVGHLYWAQQRDRRRCLGRRLGQPGQPGRDHPAWPRLRPGLTVGSGGRRQLPLLGQPDPRPAPGNVSHLAGQPGRQQPPGHRLQRNPVACGGAGGGRQPPLLDQPRGRPNGGTVVMIWVASLDGRNPQTIVTQDVRIVGGVAVDANHLYWATSTDFEPGGRHDLAGQPRRHQPLGHRPRPEPPVRGGGQLLVSGVGGGMRTRARPQGPIRSVRDDRDSIARRIAAGSSLAGAGQLSTYLRPRRTIVS